MKPSLGLSGAVLAGILLWTAAPPGRAQATASSPAFGAPMVLYLYPTYQGTIGNPGNASANAAFSYQANGNVYDSKNRVIGKLIDASGHDLTTAKPTAGLRLRTADGTVIGTTESPSTAANVRTVSLQPAGTGWAQLNQNAVAAATPPAPVDSGGTTVGSDISKSIRSGVGGGLSETDENTSTGTSSVRDPNNKPGPSGPILGYPGYGVAVPATGTNTNAANADTNSPSSHSGTITPQSRGAAGGSGNLPSQ